MVLDDGDALHRARPNSSPLVWPTGSTGARRLCSRAHHPVKQDACKHTHTHPRPAFRQMRSSRRAAPRRATHVQPSGPRTSAALKRTPIEESARRSSARLMLPFSLVSIKRERRPKRSSRIGAARRTRVAGLRAYATGSAATDGTHRTTQAVHGLARMAEPIRGGGKAKRRSVQHVHDARLAPLQLAHEVVNDCGNYRIFEPLHHSEPPRARWAAAACRHLPQQRGTALVKHVAACA